MARDFVTYDDQRIVLDDLVAALYALLATWVVRVIHPRAQDQDGGGRSTTERTGA